MAWTQQDIENLQQYVFNGERGGYDEREVDEWLDAVVAAMQAGTPVPPLGEPKSRPRRQGYAKTEVDELATWLQQREAYDAGAALPGGAGPDGSGTERSEGAARPTQPMMPPAPGGAALLGGDQPFPVGLDPLVPTMAPPAVPSFTPAAATTPPAPVAPGVPLPGSVPPAATTPPTPTPAAPVLPPWLSEGTETADSLAAAAHEDPTRPSDAPPVA